MPQSVKSMPRPAIAVIAPDTLACIGLADIIHRMMPGAEICLFPRFAAFVAQPAPDDFFHYFVDASELLAGAAFFLSRQQKTIVLTHGDEAGHLPQGFHTLNVLLSESELVRSILSLAHRSHHAHGVAPEAVRRAGFPAAVSAPDAAVHPHLTPREREVLKGVVMGLINKEIAARMGVSPATVITHRKNLAEKLGTRSVSALTIFAVTHGIVRSEDI